MKLLTDTDYIHALIAEGEHQQQDFKFEISDARKIAKTLSAFANTNGGRLLIGVKDNGKIAGVRSEEEKYMIEAAAQREQLLLDQLEHGTLLSLNRYCRQTGLSRRAAEHLLAKFVRYDIVEPVFENHKFYFRIKDE